MLNVYTLVCFVCIGVYTFMLRVHTYAQGIVMVYVISIV